MQSFLIVIFEIYRDYLKIILQIDCCVNCLKVKIDCYLNRMSEFFFLESGQRSTATLVGLPNEIKVNRLIKIFIFNALLFILLASFSKISSD
jgi:hypothetical protein